MLRVLASRLRTLDRKPRSDSLVQTILGPKPPGTLARVATHEHLLKFDDTAMVLDELAAFRAQGGSTIVEVSTLGIVDIADRAQHAERLATLSREGGVQIIAATGFYKEPRLPSFVMDWSMERLANHMITEIRDGIGGTEHRAGIIGEVGSSNYRVFPTEEKVLRAAGLAQAATGVAISTHTGRATMVHEQLDLFEDEGARLDRVVIGHLDVHPHLKSLRNVYQEVLDRGAYVQFDTVGKQGFFELQTECRLWAEVPLRPRAGGDDCRAGAGRIRRTHPHLMRHRHAVTDLRAWWRWDTPARRRSTAISTRPA